MIGIQMVPGEAAPERNVLVGATQVRIHEGARKVGHPANRWQDDIEEVGAGLLEEMGGERRITPESRKSGQRLRRPG